MRRHNDQQEDEEFHLRWRVPSTSIPSTLDPNVVVFPDHDTSKKSGRRNIPDSTIIEILSECAAGESQASMARRHGISTAMISYIVHGKRRKIVRP
jgi:hypothetical protein